MFHSRTFLVLLLTVITIPLWAGDKKSNKAADPCKQPPGLLSKTSNEDIAQGTVAIAISEEGDVTNAKVMNASSSAAADLLLARARAMKFALRPGCGVFKTIVNFTLNGL